MNTGATPTKIHQQNASVPANSVTVSYLVHVLRSECMKGKSSFASASPPPRARALCDFPKQIRQSVASLSANFQFCLFNITENPFISAHTLRRVVLLKPAWTDSVKPVQIVNNGPGKKNNNPDRSNIQIGSAECERGVGVPVEANGRVINPALRGVTGTRLHWMQGSHTHWSQ